MKHPKHYCTKCDKQTFLTIREKREYAMYHCRQCGEEICRVGDLPPIKSVKKIKGGIDLHSLPEDVVHSHSDQGLVLSFPEVLSDEHTLWPSRNEELEWKRHNKLAEFIVQFAGLTARQKEVVYSIQKYKTQTRAAKELGISVQAVNAILKDIQERMG